MSFVKFDTIIYIFKRNYIKMYTFLDKNFESRQWNFILAQNKKFVKITENTILMMIKHTAKFEKYKIYFSYQESLFKYTC